MRLLQHLSAAILIYVALAACAATSVRAAESAHSPAQSVQTELIKVACVGDSITYGLGLPDRDDNSYPAQLGKMLGKGWDVSNCGATGHTLLENGNAPYVRSKQYKDALALKPDVVVIMLGTNDTKPDNWSKNGEYIGDYLALIESFRNLDSKPVVWICNPVPVFPERWGITDKVVREEIIPRIQDIAQKAGVPVIDLHTPFQNHPELFPDQVHPNAAGATEMAKIIAALLSEYGQESPSLPKPVAYEPVYDFEVACPAGNSRLGAMSFDSFPHRGVSELMAGRGLK